MNSSYFEDPTDKLQFNGKEIGVLKKGDTQTIVNEKLAQEIELLKSTKKEVSTNTTTANLKNESAFGIDKSEVDSGERIFVTVEPREGTIYVSYEYTLADNIEKLNSNISIEGIRSNIKTVLNESDKLVSGFYLQPDNFPATLLFDANVNRNGSIERLSAKIPLQPTGDNTNYTLYKRVINGSNLETQKDVNEFLFRELNRLNKISVEKTVFVNGVEKNLSEAFVILNDELLDAKKTITEMKNLTTT